PLLQEWLREALLGMDLCPDLAPACSQGLSMNRQHPDLDLFDGEADEEPAGMLGLPSPRYGRSCLIAVPIHEDQNEIIHWVGRDDPGQDVRIQSLSDAAQAGVGKDCDAWSFPEIGKNPFDDGLEDVLIESGVLRDHQDLHRAISSQPV